MTCIERSDDEALVLFEFVSRYSEDRRLTIEDPAEQAVLWAVCGALEKTLVGSFKPDYADLLEAARNRLRDRWGLR